MKGNPNLPGYMDSGFNTAFTTFYQGTRGLVRNIALHIAGTGADLDNMTHEAFGDLLATLQRGKRIDNPRAYVCRIVTNLALDHFNAAKHGAATMEMLPEIVAWASTAKIVGPEVAFEHEELRKAIAAELDERLRHTLLLREVAGLSVGEVAQILGIKRASVATNVLRAKRQLRKFFEDKTEIHSAMRQHLEGGNA
ncbi:RNA polymerase sigma factor [Streptomyces lydicamycinicus]